MNAIVKFDELVKIDRNLITTTTLHIAQGLGLQHASVIKLVRHYQSDFEEFGLVRFEISNSGFEISNSDHRKSTRGRHTEYAVLNEQQSTLLMTYWRNTEKVRQFKKALVRAFFEARAMINSGYFDLVEQRGLLSGIFGVERDKASQAGHDLNAWKHIRDDLQTAIARVDNLIQPCLNFEGSENE